MSDFIEQYVQEAVRQAVNQAKESSSRAFVRPMLEEGQYMPEEIAAKYPVSLEQVLAWKAELEAEHRAACPDKDTFSSETS